MSRIAAAVVLAALPSVTLAMTQAKELPAPAAGLWHLLQKNEDEQNIPQHRVDIRLYPTPAPFRAAMVHRGTGQDMPERITSTTFDGRKLRLEMKGDRHGFLEMTWDGKRFEGTYLDPAGKPFPESVPLKLVKSPS
jgi:hypothetical protein